MLAGWQERLTLTPHQTQSYHSPSYCSSTEENTERLLKGVSTWLGNAYLKAKPSLTLIR